MNGIKCSNLMDSKSFIFGEQNLTTPIISKYIKNIIVLIIYLLLFPILANAQKTIVMEVDHGLFKIPCYINGAKVKMIFDTGASTVSMSKSLAEYLYENDYLSNEDFIGKGKTIVADGSIVDNLIINIKDIEISGMHLKNVKALVSSSSNAPLLLGQSAIQQLGRISLEGNHLIINSISISISEEERNSIFNQTEQFYASNSYYAMIEPLERVEQSSFFLPIKLNDGFTVLDMNQAWYYYLLVKAYYETKRYDDAINYAKKWLDYYSSCFEEYGYEEYEDSSYPVDNGSLYYLLGLSYFDKKNYLEATRWLEKAASRLTNIVDFQILSKGYLAFSYSNLEQYYRAKDLYEQVYMLYKKDLDLTEEDIDNRKCNNTALGTILYFYAETLYKLDQRGKSNKYMSLSAKCNYNYAKQYCKKYDIDY